MKIYTKMGDGGKTMLADGSFVSKSHERIESYGTCDELNSHIGMLISFLEGRADAHQFVEMTRQLLRIQNHLFDIGSELATPGLDPSKSKLRLIGTTDIALLESEIDGWQNSLAPLRNFLLPGGNPANAQAHICRTVCRRAERLCVRLAEREVIRTEVLVYLNRLSDWFFVGSRLISHLTGSPEILWQPKLKA
jgi:cob(I)alamin adenosyltransferase